MPTSVHVHHRPRTAALALILLLGSACGDGGADREPERGRALYDAPASASDSAPPPLEVPARAPVVAFLGDSIGAGLHQPEHRAFPAVLERRFFERGRPFRLINASESGRTSAGGVTALDWVLKSEPDVVVIELGGNDGLRGISVADVERNLRGLIERARDSGALVLLLGVRLPPNYEGHAEEFDALYPRLAAETGVRFVPYFMEGVGGVPEMNVDDGLHPTVQGHEKLADNVEKALAEALDALRAETGAASDGAN